MLKTFSLEMLANIGLKVDYSDVQEVLASCTAMWIRDFEQPAGLK